MGGNTGGTGSAGSAGTVPDKVCVVCRLDCSKRMRTKDAQGRYTCQACVDRLAAQPAVGMALEKVQVGGASGAPDEALLPEPVLSIDLLQAEAEAQAKVAEDRVIDLSPPELAPAPTAKGSKPRRMPTYPGMIKSTLPSKCSKCGYALAGLESTKCPECGTINAPRDNYAILQEQSRALARKTWITPIVVTILCLAFSCGVLLLVKGGWVFSLVLLVQWVIMVPVGLLAFWLCTLVFLEFDSPWGVTALRFGQIQAILTIPGAILALLGVGGGSGSLYGIFTGIITMTFLYSIVLEIEKLDALWLALVQKVVEVVVGLGVIFLLVSMGMQLK